MSRRVSVSRGRTISSPQVAARVAAMRRLEQARWAKAAGIGTFRTEKPRGAAGRSPRGRRKGRRR